MPYLCCRSKSWYIINRKVSNNKREDINLAPSHSNKFAIIRVVKLVS